MKRIFALFVLLLLVVVVFAANEIHQPYRPDAIIYAIVRRSVDKYVWSVAVSGWRAANDANITDYDITLTDANLGDYYGDFPVGITTAGIYSVSTYIQAGASPAITDLEIGRGKIPWDGSAEITEYSAYLIWQAIKADTDAVDSNGEFRIRATGSDTLIATAANQDIIISFTDPNDWMSAADVCDSASWALEDYNSPTKAELDTAIATIPTAEENRDAIFAKTGITAGGTWTYEKIIKLQTAWLLGEWQDKAGSPGVYQILDAEDQNTAVVDVNINTTSKYKQITIP